MDLKLPLCLVFMLTGAAAEWKPGQCPTSYGALGICVQECEVDIDCYGNQKCCKNGCGTTCQNPENIGVPHAGLCPAVNDSEPALCIDPPPCEVDQDCMSHEKCCFTGCSFMCVASERLEENRVGICPAEAPAVLRHKGMDPPIPTNCSALPRCADDRDCGVDRKCCSDAMCGRTCTEPVYACYHNGRTYRNREDVIESNGCSSCSCLDGFLACAEGHCDPALYKIRILTICLIVLGAVCLTGSILSFLKYQHSKRSGSVKNKSKNQAVNMMTHELEYIEAVPTKV